MGRFLLSLSAIVLILAGSCAGEPDAVDSKRSGGTDSANAGQPGVDLLPFADLLENAEAGDAEAQFQLGYAYFNGTGVDEDHLEAANWFEQSARQGHDGAQYLLGYMHYEGLGLTKDDVEAVHWVRQAAEQGRVEGEYLLGYLYYKGHGVERNYIEAHFWLSRAKENGFAQAIATLELCENEMSESELEQARAQSAAP